MLTLHLYRYRNDLIITFWRWFRPGISIVTVRSIGSWDWEIFYERFATALLFHHEIFENLKKLGKEEGKLICLCLRAFRSLYCRCKTKEGINKGKRKSVAKEKRLWRRRRKGKNTRMRRRRIEKRRELALANKEMSTQANTHPWKCVRLCITESRGR